MEGDKLSDRVMRLASQRELEVADGDFFEDHLQKQLAGAIKSSHRLRVKAVAVILQRCQHPISQGKEVVSRFDETRGIPAAGASRNTAS